MRFDDNHPGHLVTNLQLEVIKGFPLLLVASTTGGGYGDGHKKTRDCTTAFMCINLYSHITQG